MIEMLGVLALIAVLTVGGIAGYSKAMWMYKLNRLTYAYNTLLHQVLIWSPQIGYSSSENAEIHTALFTSLDIVPEEFKLYGDSRFLVDEFDNQIWIYANPDEFAIGYSFTSTRYGKDICMALIKIVQTHHSELNRVHIDNVNPDEVFAATGQYATAIFVTKSSKTCNPQRETCLSNLRMADIDRACNSCNERFCRFSTLWTF